MNIDLTYDMRQQVLECARAIDVIVGSYGIPTSFEASLRHLLPDPNVWRFKGRDPDGYYMFERPPGTSGCEYRIRDDEFWGGELGQLIRLARAEWERFGLRHG